MPRSYSFLTVPISSETVSDFVAASARLISRPASVKTFWLFSVRIIEFMYMCWARARSGSLPQACRVRSHCSACSPCTLCGPAVIFRPEPPGTPGSGRSQTFWFTQTSTPPTASAIETTPAKSIVIQWSM
ncbi:hypothetical protein SVIOM342S_07101 [Streptomyces violaceorubidus]